MAEVEFSFVGPKVRVARFRYENEGGASGRLDLRFSSARICGPTGTPVTFGLGFNAIGKGDPLAFLESLDEGYLNDKVSGLSVRRDDLFKTVENIRKVVKEYHEDLSAEEIIGVERLIAAAAIGGASDHRLGCEMLITSLRHSGVTCFQDDTHHLVGSAPTDANIIFHKEVWPELLLALEHHICTTPDLDIRIGAVRTGVPSLPIEAEPAETEPDEDLAP